jgi:iron complex transport system ATP-binding protein
VSAPLLEARQLGVDIGGKTVVDRLNLSLQPGESLAILGRNGAGKSTLLSTLAGLRPPRAGAVLLDGEDCALLPPRQAALRRGWLGQFQSDPFGSTVLETALTGRHPHLGRWDWESKRDAELARGALKALGLAGMEARQVHTLSGGERQRLSIATLLTQAPPLYLLDEPLSHLDLNHQMAVLELFAGAARDCGAAVVMVLHDPALAHRFCDRALLVYGDGRCAQGTVDTVLTAATLSGLYGYGLRQIEDHGQRCFIPE